MSRKTDIINFIKTTLLEINGGTSSIVGIPRSPYTFKTSIFNNSYLGRKIFDEITDFPSVTIFQSGKDSRYHIGNNIRYISFVLTFQGFVSVEESQDAALDLSDDIQYIINSLHHRQELCALDVVDAKLIRTTSDEGLYSPYGFCELDAMIQYQQLITI